MSDQAATSRRQLRTVLIAAGVVLLLILVTPVLAVAIRGPNIYESGLITVVMRNLELSADDRSLELPVDSSVTLATAHLAFRRAVGVPGDEAADWPRPWTDTLPSDLFADVRIESVPQLDLAKLLMLRRRLTADERNYLAAIANSPVWAEWDKVARAGNLDVTAISNPQPFRPDITTFEINIIRLSPINAMSIATAARAAHHLAAGRRDSATFAIRSTHSVGRLIQRDAASAIEALIGRNLADRSQSLANHLRGDSTTYQRLLMPPRDTSAVRAADARARMLAVVNNRAQPRQMRVEALMLLGLAPCTNVKEMLFGPSSEIEAAVAAAEADLYRVPSDSSLFEVFRSAPTRVPQSSGAGSTGMIGSLSAVASALTFNPRMNGCGKLVSLVGMF